MPTVLSQLLSYLPKRDFRRCVEKHRGDHNTRTFRCWDQLICMIVAQLAHKESLREIETCMRGMGKILYHAGIRGKVSRATLADANENRSSKIYADFCHILIERTRKLYANDTFIKEVNGLVYVLDSTIITLSLSLCPWAYFGVHPPAAMKLHTQLDLRGSIPSFLHVSKAKMPDPFFLDRIIIEAGAFYIMDRGYFDLVRFYKIHTKRAYFVTRSKRHVKFKRLKSNHKKADSHICSDQIVRFAGKFAKRNFPERIRRIRYRDPETKKTFCFLTNNFELPATTIADLYKARWQIELFFKWIKQNLRLNTFIGNSRNAIEIQIWTAVAAYLCVAMAKKQLRLNASLTDFIQFLPQALFLKMPIYQAFCANKSQKNRQNVSSTDNQSELF